jgi:hypothetical protein
MEHLKPILKVLTKGGENEKKQKILQSGSGPESKLGPFEHKA